MIFSSWWFWIIVIAIIGLVVAIILFFATDVNRLTVYILLGVFILLLILGIVFAIRSYRKPKPKQNFGDRFIPGFSEGRAIAGKTGLSDLRRKVTGSTTGALGSAGRGVGRTAKGVYGNKRLRKFGKGQVLASSVGVIGGAAGLVLGGPIGGTVGLAASGLISGDALLRNKSIVETNRRKALMKKQKQVNQELQFNQLEQQIQQQQMGGMPQQQMGGMPQQQMGGMSQQQMGGMPQQQMA